jgi:plastocyanin
MRRGIIAFFAFLLTVSGVAIAPAAVEHGSAAFAATKQKFHFEYGPLHINPGQNIIQFSGSQVPKPNEDGWITSIKPNILLPDGKVPPVDIIHLHHAVWLNLSRSDATSSGLPERFFAAGEEKTYLSLPTGYGYPVKKTDFWLLNYMIHDLVSSPFDVRITYDITFVPASSGKQLYDVIPLWMDVQNGSSYPVFDVHRGSGTGGTFTYPDQASNPYGGGPAKNTFTMPTGGTLVWTAGHLHPGGLYTDLYVDRGAQTAHVFRSNAKYYEKAGPVSGDVSLGATTNKWKVKVNPGDTLRVSATYDSSQWAWYESMGIMIVWFAPNSIVGTDAFSVTDKLTKNHLTHGHLKENNNHGGQPDPSQADPSTLASGPLTSNVEIEGFKYDGSSLAPGTQTPTVKAGNSITFTNDDAPASGYGIWHSITSCQLPCNKTTDVAYPTANAPIEFDSGQLGNDGQPTAGTLSWQTPNNLPTGTYAYFCRVHPFMRGAFRVVSP